MNQADRDSFVDFVHASSARLTRLATMLIGERQGSDDLVQAAYERTLRHWPRLNREGDPESYARRILVNLAIDGGRARARRPEVLTQPPEVAIHDCADLLTERMRVLEALQQLPKQQRAVIVLRHYQDMSEQQIAEVLGCSAGTVKSTASRATKRLRELLSSTSNGSGSTDSAAAPRPQSHPQVSS